MTERLKGKSFNHKAQWRPNHFVISCLSFSSLLRVTAASVTRLGDLLNFGQVFKAFGNN